MKRLLPPVLFLLCGLGMIALHKLLPLAHWMVWPWRGLGVVPVALGLGMIVTVALTFRRVRTNIHTFRNPDKLVTGGLFRISRNPIYLGFALALLGGVLLSGSLSALLGPLLFWFVADRWYIPFEEDRLRANFGADYDSYCRQVRRWL
ncbi:methyltransferase family protein [Rhodovibrionaceae bacterium A322]